MIEKYISELNMYIAKSITLLYVIQS